MSIMDRLLKGVPQSCKHTQTNSQVTIIAFRKCLSPVYARLFLCDTLSSGNMCAFHSNYKNLSMLALKPCICFLLPRGNYVIFLSIPTRQQSLTLQGCLNNVFCCFFFSSVVVVFSLSCLILILMSNILKNRQHLYNSSIYKLWNNKQYFDINPINFITEDEFIWWCWTHCVKTLKTKFTEQTSISSEWLIFHCAFITEPRGW